MNDSITKIMQSLDLDYSKAILSTLHFGQQIESTNKQLQGMKGIALQTAKDINTAFASQLGSGAGAKTLVDQYGNAFKTVQSEAKKATASVNSFGNTANAHSSVATAAKQHSQSVKDVANSYSILESEWNRRTSWFLSGTLFYGMINGAKEAVSTIKDVEMGMVEIARIMDDSTFSFEGYRDQLLQLGVDYGQTFENVQDIALRWAQAGYNVKDSLELTRTALLALNTAELDATNATESMIGIMAQWGLQAGDLELVIDKVNKTADDYTVSSQDLVDGLLRSSAAAKNMNMTLEETIAILTLMRESSGRTGRETGNALNSILSYMQRPKSIETLEGLGISMFTDAAKTQFRSATEIFKDIASSWNTVGESFQNAFVKAADDTELFNEELATALGLQNEYNLASEEYNDIQKRDIAQASAGVYRRTYFIALIERMANIQGVLNGMTDAAGYSMRENENTMDSLEKKYQSLKASVEQLAVALGDAGLLDMLKSGIDIATGFTQELAHMDEKGHALLLTALELITAFTTLRAVGGMLGFDASFAGMGKGLQGLLSTATVAAPGWTKLIPLIGGVVTALGFYIYNSRNADDVTKVFIERQEKLISNYKKQEEAILNTQNEMNAQAETAKRLAREIDTLTQKESLNTTEKAKMKTVVEQLNGIFPQLGLEIDNQTGKVVGNTNAIYENIDALKKQAKAQFEAAQMQASAMKYVEQESVVGDISSSLQSSRAEYNDMLKQRIAAAEKIRNAIKLDKYAIDVDSANRQQSILQAMSDAEMYGWSTSQLNNVIIGIDNRFSSPDLKQKILEAQKNIGMLEKEFDEANSLLLDYDKEMQRFAEKIDNNISNENTTDTPIPYTPPPTSGGGGSSSYKNEALSEALKILDYRKYINEITVEEEIKMLNDIKAKHVNTADELMDINKRIYSAEKSLKEANEKLSTDNFKKEVSNIQHLANLGVYSVKEQIKAYKELYSVKTESLDEEQSRIENLFNLYKKLLSEQQSKIKDAYDERIRLIDEEADAEKAKKEARIQDLKEELDLLDRKDSQRSYEQTIADIRKQIEYWRVRTSEDARKKVIELEKQLDEEKYKRELEMQKQSINDKIDEVEDEVKEIDRLADEEKKKWEKSYKLTEKAFDSHSANIIALAGAMSREAYEQWEQNYLIPLQNALSSGNFSDFDSISGGLSGSVGDLDNRMKNGTNAQIYNAAKAILDLKEQWTNGSTTAAGQATQYYNTLRNLGATGKSVADQLTMADYPTAKDIVANLPRYHTGRLNGMEELAVLRKDEIVFPPELSRGLRALFPIISNIGKNGDSYDNRKHIRIDKLVNIENNRMEDNTDEWSFAREINRTLNTVL